MAQKLTEVEIEYILDFIKPNLSIPIETAESLVNLHKNKLRKQLVNIELYKEDIEDLKKEIMKCFFKSQTIPGESVGMCAAQSYGEINTQSTLNTFHKAGDTDKTVVTGVARFEELINATKLPKSSSCFLYLKYGNKSIKEIRNTVKDSITELSIDRLCSEVTEIMNKDRDYWYDIYESIYNKKIEFKHCIRLKLKMNVMYEFLLKIEDITKKLKIYDDFHVVHSPHNIGIIDIFIDTSNIQLSDEQLYYITDENKEIIYLQEVVKPNIKNIIVSGIKGIKNIFYLKDKSRPGEWMIETEGSNIPELMSLDFIDTYRSYSNNPWDMLNFFGISSAKSIFYNEFIQLMPTLNTCHAKLLCSKMTITGTIMPLTRFSVKKDTCGPISKASFEESTDNFINAAIYGEEENTKGVSASIICGKRPIIGTGIMDLTLDIDKILSS